MFVGYVFVSNYNMLVVMVKRIELAYIGFFILHGSTIIGVVQKNLMFFTPPYCNTKTSMENIILSNVFS